MFIEKIRSILKPKPSFKRNSTGHCITSQKGYTELKGEIRAELNRIKREEE